MGPSCFQLCCHVERLALFVTIFVKNSTCPTPENGLCKDDGRRLSHEDGDLDSILENTENREDKLTYGVDQGKKLQQKRN